MILTKNAYLKKMRSLIKKKKKLEKEWKKIWNIYVNE